VLFASPATNLFSHDADPVNLDHKQTEYRITPGGDDPSHYQVYSVERVTGLAPGTARRREYTPFELFAADEKGMGHYTITRRLSQVRPEAETFLAVVYPPRAGPPTAETLSVELLCTNASLPESLKLGDICRPTATSPDLCEFKNIRAPTLPQQPPLDRNLLWRFLSHLSLNMLSLANRDNLKQLLRLYIFPEGRDRTTIVANQRRIEGITGIEVRTVKRLVSGLPMQGQEILMEVDSSHFAGTGDLYLFGTILDMFLGAYASINSFSHFKMKDSVTGEITTWPVRIGDRPLI
jgi:type VI secretion system protein ImpG